MMACIPKRLKNTFQWCVLMGEGLIYTIFYLCTLGNVQLLGYPYSTAYLIDVEAIDMNTLNYKERSEVITYVMITGWAAVITFAAMGFGLLGAYGPCDVFNKDSDNPMTVIISRRRNDKCAVCLQRFEFDQSVKMLECKHTYHKHCIDEWFIYSPKCPICRSLRKN